MANYFAAVAGNFNAASTWASTAAGAGGAGVPAAGDNAYANGKTVTITADLTCAKISNEAENGATAGGTFTCSTAGVTINANLNGGTTAILLTLSTTLLNAVVTINGNITAGGSYGVYFNPTALCTLNVTGNVTGGTGSSCYGIAKVAAGTINITGTVSAKANVNDASGIKLSAAGSVNITGDVYGSGSAGGSGHGIQVSVATATLNVTGNVYGGYFGVYSAGSGVINGAAAVVNITGNCYGSSYSTSTCPGVDNNSTGTLTIIGKAVGGAQSPGAKNSSTGTLKVTRAVGNGYGVGTSGLTAVPGVESGLQTSLTYVEEIEYGALGQTPTSGTIMLTDKSTNVALFYRQGTTQKTLADATNVAGAIPAASDVRYGTVYNYGGNTGTCRVPAAGSVALGALVDNTTGTAVLTPAAVWSALTSSMTTSGSIGERLANASTVTSVGQQLSNALSA